MWGAHPLLALRAGEG